MKNPVLKWMLLVLCSIYSIEASSQALNKGSSVTKWVAGNPFENNVFIENKGQFTEKINNGQPSKYYSRKGRTRMYFSDGSVILQCDSIRYSEKESNSGDNIEEEENNSIKRIPEHLTISFKGSNPGAKIEVLDPVSEYFTYEDPADKSGHSGIIAHAWQKLIYHNIYNNIDIEFYYPENKEGIEYDIIINPGGNVSDVKMVYSDNTLLKLSGQDMQIFSPCLNLITHAPIAKNGIDNNVKTKILVNKNTVSFQTDLYDNTKPLIIDPWVTGVSFGGSNKVFDIDYDYLGNVYVGGGDRNIGYFVLKYNSSGKLQWTYSAPFSCNYYGAFTLDRRNGTSYFAQCWNNDNIVKVDNIGLQTAMFNNSGPLLEIFKLKFDYINNQVVIGGGNLAYTYQAGTIDTSLTNLIPVNVLSATLFHHDMCLLALDGAGNAYMAPAKALGPDSANFDNVLLRLQLPLLVPTIYMVPDGYHFVECSSIGYYPPTTTNGFNGMVANNSTVVTYDGETLKKWMTPTGAFVKSTVVTTTPFKCGGLDMDCQGNLYVGDNNEVVEYDSTLDTLLTSISCADTVYGLAVSTQGELYTCGNGFVQESSIPVCSIAPPESSCANIFIPDAFSPNNDGQNDILYVRSECIKTIVFEIFDRWGNKVFETNSESIGWDGTYRGKPMNTGTYVYYLNATLFNGSTVEKKGNVTLVR